MGCFNNSAEMQEPTTSLPCFPADDHTRNETNDFIDEALVLLNGIYPNTPPRFPDVQKYLHDERVKNRFMLYNWIALSLVRREQMDVAAVAVYETNEGLTVYYTKTSMDEGDEAHAEKFAEMVRTFAKQPPSTQKFQKDYFDLVIGNCTPRLRRRISELLIVSQKKQKYSSSHFDQQEKTDIDEVSGLLQAASTSGGRECCILLCHRGPGGKSSNISD
jgi:hypothetical protein